MGVRPRAPRFTDVGQATFEASRSDRGAIAAYRLQAANEMFLSLTDTANKHLFCTGPKDKPQLALSWLDDFGGVLASQQSMETEVHHAGSWWRILLIPCREDAVNVLVTDGPETQRQYDQLTQENRYLRSVIDSMPDLIYWKDIEGRFLDCNTALERLVGLTPDKILGKTDRELFPQAEAAEFEKNDLEALSGRLSGSKRWFNFRDGRNVFVETRKTPLQDKNGEIIGIVGVGRDLTKQHQAKEALRQSEERLSLVLRASRQAPWDWNLLTDEMYFSSEWLAMLGLGEEPLVATSDYGLQLLHPTDKGKVLHVRHELLGSNIRYIDITMQLRHAAGYYVPVQFKGMVVRDDTGRAVRIIGTSTDITEQQRLNKELRVKGQCMDSSLNAIALVDLNGSLTYVNESFLQLWGYDDEKQVLGRSTLDLWAHPEQAQRIIDSLHAEGHFVGELVARRVDGALRTVHLSSSIVYDEDGEPICRMASFFDTTRRKELERLLKETQREACICGWSWDVRKREVSWTDEVYRIHGWDTLMVRNGSENAAPETLDRPEPKECSVILKACQQCAEHGKAFSLELPFTPANGESRWLRIAAHPAFEGSEVSSVDGYVMDITEQKLTEQRLTSSTDTLTRLYQSLDHEITKARTIHERLLPERTGNVEHLSYAVLHRPAWTLGGDFCSVVRKKNKAVFYLSDVTGHGLDGAILSSQVKHILDTYIELVPVGELTPSAIGQFLANSLCRSRWEDDYALALFLGVIDIERKRLDYISAGAHTPPLLTKPGQPIEDLPTGGLPLSCAIPQQCLDLPLYTVALQPSMRILFSTDGLFDQEVNGRRFEDYLRPFFFQNQHLPPTELINALEAHFCETVNREEQMDDVTVLALSVQ